MKFVWASGTHSGRVRKNNEDVIHPEHDGYSSEPVLVAVADGLGGHRDGEVASPDRDGQRRGCRRRSVVPGQGGQHGHPRCRAPAAPPGRYGHHPHCGPAEPGGQRSPRTRRGHPRLPAARRQAHPADRRPLLRPGGGRRRSPDRGGSPATPETSPPDPGVGLRPGSPRRHRERQPGGRRPGCSCARTASPRC